MCGLAGLFLGRSGDRDALFGALPAMLDALRHRGPDAGGSWQDRQAGVALGHRRLSILDLSPAGAQPMTSADARHVIVFNGEIYNHQVLRADLAACGAAPAWRGHSDTETLLAAIACWGLQETLRRSVGMFALALWDRAEQSLSLACDRFGEKPLYYGLHGGFLLFASELKAIRACRAFHGEVDRQALALLLSHNAIPAPHSIYRGIFKLLPGTVLCLQQTDLDAARLPQPVPYWTLCEVAQAGQRNPFEGSEEEAADELDRLLRQSVAGQMLADVPLGAFLSGGIDSSAVVASMQAQSATPVRTFTIGFHESAYNEAGHARAVAAHLGTAHTELYVTPEQAQAVIPRLHELYDEPFADSSQIPTFLVCELARQHVTVCLSGDGGDESFGGYNRHVWGASLWRRLRCLPRSLRAALAGMLTVVPPGAWDQVFHSLERCLPQGWRYANPGDKLHKLAEILAVKTPDEIYAMLVAHWKRPHEVVSACSAPPLVPTLQAPDWLDLEQRMMYLDTLFYLPNDILVKVDRAAMAVSLETRVPFLDHRLVEFAWRLPGSLKIRDGRGKWLLRQVLDRYVPRDLIERPKMGFGIPLDAWLRGPLRDWAENLLAPSRLAQEGYFRADQIRSMWQQHLSGRRNWAYHLWDVLMFQAWLAAEGSER